MGLKYANFYISYNFFKILNPFPKHFYISGQRLAWLCWNDISCHRVYTVWYWIELFKSIIHESVQSVIALLYNTHNTWNSYCVVTPCLKSDYSYCDKIALNPLILCTHESQTWIQKFLKEINGAFSVTLLCKSNWVFFFTPFRFLDLYMKILYDTDAKNGIYLVLYPYAAHRRCCGAILAYASLISVSPLLDSRAEDRNLYVYYGTTGIGFSTFFFCHLPLVKHGQTW